MISSRQRMWDLMRRDKVFKVEKILAIQCFSQQTVRNFLIPLEIAGALSAQKRCKFSKRIYILNPDRNEYKAPSVNLQRVYFHKSDTSCDIGARSLLKKALKTGMSQQGVADKIGTSKATVNRVIHNNYPNPATIYKKIRECL
ncbi:helix-turn-helix transcriptional regulator [Sulfurimonas sp.]|uniref:helix-turn-helix domain-containing protein n=1 Tax=Sulfurimonas sp. TaxID=2022749 RepID=UPI0025EC54AE|nr:helix-turn-helix transcriptional regulator [Sulfurimonas sp.]